MSAEIPLTQRLAILRHLAGGKGLDVTATIVRLSVDQVRDVASLHGWPDREKLGWAADRVEERIRVEEDASITKSTLPEIRVDQRLPAQQRPTPTPAPPVGRGDDIRVLLNTGKGHSSKRIQNAADRASDAIDRLRTLIREDAARAEAKAKESAEKAAARAEVERLARELREAKAKLKRQASAPGGRATVRSGQLAAARSGALVTSEELAERGVDSKQVRAWARENDVECSDTGRLPHRVLAAWDAAHKASGRAS